MSALCAGTVAGNAAVLVALRRLQRAPAHYPLASLAAADLLLGLFVLPIGMARELFVFHLHWLICACWSTLDVLCCTASILSICLLGWERWRGITAPLARAYRSCQAKVSALLIWPVSAAVALPTAFVPSHAQYPDDRPPKACIVNTNVVYVFVSSFFSFFLPATIMVILYVQILRALETPPPIPMRAHRGRTPAQHTDDKSTMAKENGKTHTDCYVKNKIQKLTALLVPNGDPILPSTSSKDTEDRPSKSPSALDFLSTRRKRACRTIVRLMALFLFCWTPFFIMLPLDSVCECVSAVAWQLCPWLGYLNSALNPAVYAASSPSIRKAIYDTFSSTRTTDVAMSSVRR